ncbi:alpha/beta hydrolase [Streptomyces sp. MZ04]|uniref:alpha/beta hydrolase n=1 Tax=Streptomyces sp. MZ04 TaxID=2559236 RepID=UPI00107E8D07|nr:alpha/beta hydrolase [Streptomyces sp. MZ04]TGA89251.1 alpha/beta hydrolase [Streptomyces sp. MZ04]
MSSPPALPDDPLTPIARGLCDAMSSGFPDPADGPLDAAALRAASRAGLGLRPVLPVRSVTERVTPVPVRIYDDGEGGGGRDRPLIVFFHGGGWVLCDLDTHDGLCRELAVRTGAVVVSADYRRAPEHRFPAAADDAFAVLEWAAGHAEELGCDPARVVVAGDSSGGNLAAGCALRARDEAGPAVAAQVLLYPVLDHRFESDSVSASAYASGFFHTTAHMRWYWEQYVGPGGDRVAASPGLAADLTGLPPALFVLADCDPLRDEGIAYARRLAGVGVSAEVRLYPGVFHGFLGAGGVLLFLIHI